MPRRRRPSLPVLLAGGLLVAIVLTPWYRLNLSASLPRGLYRLTAVQTPLVRESLVVLAAPASVQPWIPWWLPLLKPVAALPGDLVCVREAGLYIGERYYGPVYTSADGKALPRVNGCVHLQPGEIFVASPRPGSVDGRYFGPTPVESLKAQAAPVWTWE